MTATTRHEREAEGDVGGRPPNGPRGSRGSGGSGGPGGPRPPGRPRTERERRLARHRAVVRRRRLVAGVGAAGIGVAAVWGARQLTAPSLAARGPARASEIGRAALPRLAFTVAGRDPRHQHWRLDGHDVTPRVEGATIVYRPGHLADGRHELSISTSGGLPGPLAATTTRRFSFVVDTAPPVVRLAAPAVALLGSAGKVSGTAPDASKLTADGRPVRLAGGRFTLTFRAPHPRPIRLVATDAAGNASRWSMPVNSVGRRPPVPIRAVHMTALGWADATLRGRVLALIAEHRINAVELDLKEEGGIVGWRSGVPLARRIGAQQPAYDLPAAVRTLHAKGVRVIGRLVCFADPILAGAAWKAGHRQEVIQTPDHQPYSGYGGFANFADPTVRGYLAGIAVAGARAGVDEVLLDYVRRPDGPLSTMVFPGLHGTPEAAIVAFLTQVRTALQPYRTLLGASVFGIAATRPTQVAQDIPAMAKELDYVAPMVYPSHWGPGEYGLADPDAQPYEIVRRSLADFEKDVRGSGARIMPWLQDFSLGRTYGAPEVQAQIRAAKDAGANDFLLWNAGASYTADALSTDAAAPALGIAPPTAPAGAVSLVRVADPTPAAATQGPAPLAPVGDVPIVKGARPDELGQVPVLMHHEIRADRVGDYDQTPAEFRAELEKLYLGGYVPIRASDLVNGTIDVPTGTTPVVMTFDDSTRFQLTIENGQVAPDTAMGIMLDFARTHPGFRPAGTFYILKEPFGGVAAGAQDLRWLVQHGFELGNHTLDHLPLRTLSDTAVQRELVQGAQVIEKAVPGYPIRTMALPLGSMPHHASLAVRGRWKGQSYGPYAVFLVGANPAPSPFARTFDPSAIPRIRSSHAGQEVPFTADYWLRILAAHPEERYISDGDPNRVSFPAAERSRLAPAFAARARAY